MVPPPHLTLAIILEGRRDYLRVPGVRQEQKPHSSTFWFGPGGDVHLPGLSQRLSQGTVISSDRTKRLPLPAERPPCTTGLRGFITLNPMTMLRAQGRHPSGRTRKQGWETWPRSRASDPQFPAGSTGSPQSQPPCPLAGGPREEGHCELSSPGVPVCSHQSRVPHARWRECPSRGRVSRRAVATRSWGSDGAKSLSPHFPGGPERERAGRRLHGGRVAATRDDD